MSGVLEPSFLLELGAYAVAVAGIRLFKNKYWRASTSPSEGTPGPEQPGHGQAAPPTVLGLGQASPLTTPASPRRSPSPPPQTECQLATPVLHYRLHEADSVLFPGATSSSYRRPGAVAATASATELPAAEDLAAAETPTQATAVLPDEEMLDIAATNPNPDNDGADADMQTQPADEDNHISLSHSYAGHDNMGDDPMDGDSVPETEICEASPEHNSPAANAGCTQFSLGVAEEVQSGAAPLHPFPGSGCFQLGMQEEVGARELQPATGLTPFHTAEEMNAAWLPDRQEGQEGPDPTWAPGGLSEGRKAAATGVDRCFPLVSEPGPVPDADMTGDQDVPSLTAPTEQDTQATSSSEAGDWECQGRPTFKLVLVGDSGTEIISGDELAALAEARLLASGSQAQEEAAGQEADKEGDYVMCDSSDDEDEGICADISKGVSQDDDPSSFPPHVNSGGAAQQGSSAELLIEDSASDGEVQPGLAEETVVTHRDILLRAVKQRKRNIAEGDIGTHCMSASRKKQCGSGAAGLTEAGRISSPPPNHTLGGTKAIAAVRDGMHSKSAAGHAEPAELSTEVSNWSAAISELLAGGSQCDTSAHISQPDPMPPCPTLPLPGVQHGNPLSGFPSSSDGEPQPQEGEEDRLPFSSRATAPEPQGRLPPAGIVFDEAPMPQAATEFDDALMIEDGCLLGGGTEEEEGRQACSEQPDQASGAGAACEEAEEHKQSQLQEPAQADLHQVQHAEEEGGEACRAAIHAGEEEEGVELPGSAAKLDAPSESAAEAAPGRNTFSKLRVDLSGAGQLQPDCCHEADYLSHGSHPELSADPDQPQSVSAQHAHQPGAMDQTQSTCEPQHDSQSSGAQHDSPQHHAQHDLPELRAQQISPEHPKPDSQAPDSQHDSPEHRAQHDRVQEAEWAFARSLPRVDSAPPVTPDSPSHSSASPNSPGWALSEDAWDSPVRAAPNSPYRPAWDSPPGTAPSSPTPMCGIARNSPQLRSGSRAMSGSPAPEATSPYEAAWRSPTPSQARTPLHDPTSPQCISSRINDPHDMDLARGLGGLKPYSSYLTVQAASYHGLFSLPMPPSPNSPSSPPSHPPQPPDTLPYRWHCWRPRTSACRAAALESPRPVPTSPRSPPRSGDPEVGGGQAHKEGLKPGARGQGSTDSRGYTAESRQHRVMDDPGDGMTGAVTACSPEPVPGSKQAHEDEEPQDDEAAVVQESNMRAVRGSAAVTEGRAASPLAQPSHEHPVEGSPQPSSVRVSEDTPQYPASLPQAGRRHSEDNPGWSPSWSSRSPSPGRAPDRPLHRSRASRRNPYLSDSGSPTPSEKEERAVGADHSQGTDRLGSNRGLDSRVVRIVGDSLTVLAEYLEQPGAGAATSPERILREAIAVREGRAASLSAQPSHKHPFDRSPQSYTEMSPQYSPQSSPPHSPQSSPPHSPQSSPRRSPQYSPQYSPRYSPQYSPQSSLSCPPQSPPGYSPPYSPRSSPRLAEARRHHSEEDPGLSPSWSGRSLIPERALHRPLHRRRASRQDEYPSDSDLPAPPDRGDWAVGADHSQGTDHPGSAPELHSNVVRAALAEYLEHQRAVATSSPEPDLENTRTRQEGRAACSSPQPSHEHPFACSPQPSSEDSPQYPYRRRQSVENPGWSPSWSSRSPSPGRAPDRPLHRSRASRHSEYPSDSGSPTPSDKEERAVGADHSQGTDRPGSAPEIDPAVLRDLDNQLRALADCVQQQKAAAASSPDPVDPLQAEEDELVDDPAAVGQGHAQDSPRSSPGGEAVAAFSPQPEDLVDYEEPGMMLEEEAGDEPGMVRTNRGEEWYSDEEVQFVSETGPDPSRSAFASAVERLTAARATPEGRWPGPADQEEDIELYPGVQDLISSALTSNRTRRSRHSVVDEEDDMGAEESRGRSRARRQEGRRKQGCPDARRNSPWWRRRHGSDRRQGGRGHSPERGPLSFAGVEASSISMAASMSASVSAAALIHQAGAAAAGSCAKRKRDCLSVAEGEDEEDEMEADRTCWKRLLKKSRHN